LLGLLRDGKPWQQYGREDQSMMMQPSAAGPSMQAGAALAPGISQQAFKHAAGFRIAGVVSAHATPIGEIPIEGAGLGD
jgi:hypothetical protein